MMADISGLSIERPAIAEAALLGAAIIAAVGSGAFSSLEECSEALYSAQCVFAPSAHNHALYENLFGRYIKSYQYIYQYQM
jgi:sugar (pentulose or hexulose) kinase